MTRLPLIVSGLHKVADGHDALVCDVWGVIHNGARVYEAAVDALVRFRKTFGPVVLLSNAPRPVLDLKEQFAKLGVPADCYDAIVTSGAAARDDLERRARGERLSIYHLGPERDRGIFDGLAVDCVDIANARVILCTGLFDDDSETPDNYQGLLQSFKARALPLLCANPDIVVQRGGRLIYCAGAIARVYERMGGEVVYYGKPHRPIYQMVREAARSHARDVVRRPLAVGDGLETDILGAKNAGIEALFIADGIHGEEIGDMNAPSLARLFDKAGVWPKAAMRALVW